MAASAKYIGKGTGTLALDDAVFAESFHGPLVHEAVRAELAARRRGTASTQTRGEVAMTGAKAWRQKGTGRARVGALSVADPHRRRRGLRAQAARLHGQGEPQGAPARAARGAVRARRARLDRRGGSLRASTRPPPRPPRRRSPSLDGDGRVLVVLTDGEENCVKSFRNLTDVSVMHADSVGVADVIGHARLVVSEAALARLTEKAASK